MFIIVCNLPPDTYYVPEEFEDGMYPREVEKAKKFQNQQEALTFMIENAYDQNDWYRWEVKQL
jgi:hypothetical protein